MLESGAPGRRFYVERSGGAKGESGPGGDRPDIEAGMPVHEGAGRRDGSDVVETRMRQGAHPRFGREEAVDGSPPGVQFHVREAPDEGEEEFQEECF